MGILDKTVTTIFVLLGGVAMVGVATDLAAVVAPHSARELHAYEVAPRCPAAPSAPAECRWTEEFTASEIHDVPEYKRGDRSAVLTDASGARWNTGFGHSGPVLDQLDEGDQVTGTIWRGRLIEIAAEGATQETGKVLDDAREPSDMLALILASSGLLVIGTCAWRLRRRRAAPTRAMEATLVLSVGMLFAGLLSAVAVFVLADVLSPSAAETFWLFAAIFVAAAAWLTVVTRRDLKKPRTPGIPI
ncbi:hypothetical protein E0H73_29080 [Kribbella pittospori]|uniref:Uncharacterized protein n=1 Tax=Kribbella pittospori TaxID=722689 RepID=A0A4R0KNL1_9ACTN|nr:hypothetical protein [Kribbella pittospori]TCC57445.1 hypothetical protein E0H73_29080 [Kribbella pittospori]